MSAKKVSFALCDALRAGTCDRSSWSHLYQSSAACHLLHLHESRAACQCCGCLGTSTGFLLVLNEVWMRAGYFARNGNGQVPPFPRLLLFIRLKWIGSRWCCVQACSKCASLASVTITLGGVRLLVLVVDCPLPSGPTCRPTGRFLPRSIVLACSSSRHVTCARTRTYTYI